MVVESSKPRRRGKARPISQIGQPGWRDYWDLCKKRLCDDRVALRTVVVHLNALPVLDVFTARCSPSPASENLNAYRRERAT